MEHTHTDKTHDLIRRSTDVRGISEGSHFVVHTRRRAKRKAHWRVKHLSRVYQEEENVSGTRATVSFVHR